ncbi:unnamed protein product [Effrenium voratum]|uniref:PDZ domain-containing protein n=1 Tax=Effrenium voratum TaxID=2562239 RepID=A0AA36IEN5_9DINO|nr:unnamed protein product [Effrenium voratum]
MDDDSSPEAWGWYGGGQDLPDHVWASCSMLKVSHWRQSMLQTWSWADRCRAHAAAHEALRSLQEREDTQSRSSATYRERQRPLQRCAYVPEFPHRPHAARVKVCRGGEGCFAEDASLSDAEEQSWEMHRRKAGLVAKLVCYISSAALQADFVLRGFRRSGAVVLSVSPAGPADRAGVQAGDRLVSINGQQDFACLETGDFSETEMPAKLVFMGMVGRITSEVRLISLEAPCEKSFTLAGEKAGELSKSAKKRAAKKVRDAAHAADAPPAPETTPEKPKAKAAAAPTPEPKAKPKEAAKAAAKPKATPKAKEEPPKQEPKAGAKAKGKAAPEAPKPKEAPKAKADPKAKAKAKVEPPPVEEPVPKAKGKAKAAAPAPEPKAVAKAAATKAAPKAKGGAQPPPKEEAGPERVEVVQPYAIDDGSGGDWEQSTGLSKKAEKRKEKQDMIKKQEAQMKKDQKMIPGMAPINSVPGMAQPPKAASKEEIAAFMARAAQKGAEAKAAVEAEQAQTTSMHTETIKVPENKIGIVIGPKGAKIKMIQEKTGVRIDTSGEMFTIAGKDKKEVELAHMAIKELVEKGYCSMAFEDFKEDAVPVHPTSFPDIIGKQGVTIKAFKTELNVEVKIPEVPKTSSTSSKKYKVTLAGKADDVKKAKDVLESIAKFGYHEITHPGQVEPWAYRPGPWESQTRRSDARRFIIGKAGSELRHIQNNYKARATGIG